jgi:hypothetical protein
LKRLLDEAGTGLLRPNSWRIIMMMISHLWCKRKKRRALRLRCRK